MMIASYERIRINSKKTVNTVRFNRIQKQRKLRETAALLAKMLPPVLVSQRAN